MNPEIKQQWITALRSGNFKQCNSNLKKETPQGICHCCLGVLAELAVKERIVKEQVVVSFGTSFFNFEGAGIYLLPAVTKWAGIESNGKLKSPVIFNGKENRNLASLNDAGMSFDQIANVIESQL